MQEGVGGEGGVQECVAGPKPDVFEAELCGAAALLGVGVGVLSYPEEEEEGDDAKVTLGCLDGRWVVGCVGVVEVVKDLDWDGKLGLRRWILSMIAFEEFLDPDWPRLA